MGRPLRISFRRIAIVAGVIPIETPFMYVVAQIVESESARRIQTNRLRAALPTPGVIGNLLGWRVSPWVQTAFDVAASGALPLRFARQAIGLGSHVIQPLAIAERLMPRYRDDRHFRVIEVWIVPAQWLRKTHRGKEAGVLLVRHLISSKLEGIHPDAMQWLFIISPDFATHPEPPPWDMHHHRFDDSIRTVGEAVMHGLSIHSFTCN